MGLTVYAARRVETHQGNELARNSPGNARSQSSQLSVGSVDWSLAPESGARELISIYLFFKQETKTKKA